MTFRIATTDIRMKVYYATESEHTVNIRSTDMQESIKKKTH